MLDAILVFFDGVTCGAIVQRASPITDPFATEKVTWGLLSFFLFCNEKHVRVNVQISSSKVEALDKLVSRRRKYLSWSLIVANVGQVSPYGHIKRRTETNLTNI